MSYCHMITLEQNVLKKIQNLIKIVSKIRLKFSENGLMIFFAKKYNFEQKVEKSRISRKLKNKKILWVSVQKTHEYEQEKYTMYKCTGN